MPIYDVTHLRIYQSSLRLTVKAYRLAALVEKYDRIMAHSIKKTAAQIAPQIAEGYGKKSSP